MDKIWVIRQRDNSWDGTSSLLCFRETQQEAKDTVLKIREKYREKYPRTCVHFDYVEVSK